MIIKEYKELTFDCNVVMQIADVHFGLKSSNDNSIKYLEWMDNITGYFNNFFIPLINGYIAKTYKPLIIVDGDFFDNRKNLRVDVLNSAVDIVESISKICPMVFCVGNHDTYYTDNNRVNSLRVFANIPNVYIIEDRAKIQLCGKSYEIVSWMENAADESVVVKNSTADYLILHTDINGLKYPSNVKIDGGVEPKGFKGTHIYAGHIHKRQDKGKVTYVGSPYEIDKSDAGNVKGVYVHRYDMLDDGTYDVMEEFVENTYSPKFKVFDITEIQKMKDDGLDIKETLNNNYVSIRYNDCDAPKYKDLMNYIESMGKGMEFCEIRNSDVIEEESKETLKSLSIDDAVYECINRLDISEEDKSFLKKKHDEYTKSNNN